MFAFFDYIVELVHNVYDHWMLAYEYAFLGFDAIISVIDLPMKMAPCLPDIVLFGAWLAFGVSLAKTVVSLIPTI